MKDIDLAIVGGGIAGVACAMYAKRAGIEPVIFEQNVLGGQLLYVNRVDNYPGCALGVKGDELLNDLVNSIRELKIDTKFEQIKSARIEKENIILSTQECDYVSQALVVATGATFRKLAVAGEEEFSGRGVSWCAVCDGYFFKDKEVAVAGGGNTAVEDAVYLSSICRKVYLIHRRDKLRALEYLQKELRSRDNIEVVWTSQVRRIQGKQFLERLVIYNTSDNKEHVLKVNALFVAIGI